MISSPIVPVEVKITGIIRRMQKKRVTTLKEILSDSVSLPDLIAIFLGVLELIKIRKILIHDFEGTLLDDGAQFVINDDPNDVITADKQSDEEQNDSNTDNETEGGDEE